MSTTYASELRSQLSKLADKYSDLLDELVAVKESTESICDDMSDVVENLYEKLMLFEDPFVTCMGTSPDNPWYHTGETHTDEV